MLPNQIQRFLNKLKNKKIDYVVEVGFCQENSTTNPFFKKLVLN